MKYQWLIFVALVMHSKTVFPATLHNTCGERVQSLTLTGSDTEGEGRIWNANRNGTKYWNYEGADYEVELSNKHDSNFSVTLNRFACSDHFNFYYTTQGTHQVTRTYVEQAATQLETAWDELSQNQGFRTPFDLKQDGRYEIFTNFLRIPVMVYNTVDGKNHASDSPTILLNPGLSANSRSPHHELFHVIKHGYTRYSKAWLNEGLARWSEKFVVGGGSPCGGFNAYSPITFNLLERDYCESARFFNYLAVKYGSVEAGSDGSDVIRTILEELADVDSGSRNALTALQRAVNQFRQAPGSYGQSYKEWAKGNYVNDTLAAAAMRTGAPLAPRRKESGEGGWGGNQFVWHDYSFSTQMRGAVTLQIRASAGDYDGDGDDDDVRFRLDGELVADWNTGNAFDGSHLRGKTKTVHIIRRDLAGGNHTLRIEADEHPVLYAVNIFRGEVPLLYQASGLTKWCQRMTLAGPAIWVPCFAANGDPPLLSVSFDVPASVSRVSVVLSGRASSSDQNAAGGFPESNDTATVFVDGTQLGAFDAEKKLDGLYQEGDLAVTDLRSGNLTAGSHSLEIKTLGKPYVDHVAVFATPQSPPLFRLDEGQLDPWSSNYHVIEVTSDMVPSNEDVLAPDDLTIQIGTREWSAEFEPPFHHILLINSNGSLRQAYSSADSHAVSRTISAATLGRMGVGGRVVVVAGTRDAAGGYFVQVRR